jgi:hypothetical protein
VKKTADFFKKRKSVTFLYICSILAQNDAIPIAKEEWRGYRGQETGNRKRQGQENGENNPNSLFSVARSL